MNLAGIELQNVTKSFNDHYILDDISFNFEMGCIYGLTGKNGSGKTVLLKCICGLLHLDRGTILCNGKKVGIDVDIPDSLGALIESPGYLPNYSGYRNLKYLADINRKIRKDTIHQIMKEVGLDPNSKKKVGKYSLGMRQRLGIAQAVMENPRILILDEPMNGIDNSGSHEIRSWILSQKSSERVIIISSHNKDDLEILCDTLIQIEDGKIR